MLNNQVRYNSISSEHYPEFLNWFFLIINKDFREISRIKNSIFNIFAPIISGNQTYKGELREGFHYELMNFYSQRKPPFGWKTKVFRRFLKDNKLYYRTNIDGLENYISEIDYKI